MRRRLSVGAAEMTGRRCEKFCGGDKKASGHVAFIQRWAVLVSLRCIMHNSSRDFASVFVDADESEESVR